MDTVKQFTWNDAAKAKTYEDIKEAKELANRIKAICKKNREQYPDPEHNGIPCAMCPFSYIRPFCGEPRAFCGVYGHPEEWDMLDHIGETVIDSYLRYPCKEEK